jgi:hydrogenase expression/formation protein HypC
MCLGIPARIVAISDAERFLAIADIAGVRREVDITCVVEDEAAPESCIGTWVLVHVGFAMARIDEAEAAATLAALDALGEAETAHTELTRGEAQ